MPDTRPGIKFQNGVCTGCINFEKQKTTDWNLRKNQLEKLCNRYRNKNSDYDCAIAISGGKDSHFQVYFIKEVMKMNPVLLTVGNIDSTETGKSNLENISETFGCDIISHIPNRNVLKKITKITFERYGFPTWYVDSLIYAFPIKMTINLNLELLIYGEDVNYTYGGKYDEETPSALLQPKNDVVKPIHDELIDEGVVSKKELNSSRIPTLEFCKQHNFNPIYLSYFTPWNSHRNFEIAKRWGFRHLGHEYKKENTIEDYNSIDSITYLLSEFLKYTKYGHASATQMASRWIRYGMTTREEMIPIVKKLDGVLDQGIVDGFCSFADISVKKFYEILDKWYNPELFEQDQYGLWHKKFEVGQN